MKQILQTIMERRNLTQHEMTAVFDRIMSGEITPAQMGAFLAALRMKGETVDELAGAAASMRRHAVWIDAGGAPVVDTCGTGGDATGTFNISTTAAFVVAGAGVPVAKHGNRAITSQCGSADLLTELGVNIEAPREIVEECIREAGIGFLYAPRLHPAMRHAMPVRRELGVRTIFNMLGPLTNPAGAQGQVLGVFAPELTEPFAHALRLLGSKRAFVVHGHDGMDEITTTTATRISELKEGRVSTYEFDPLRHFSHYAQLDELRGGTPAQNAAIAHRVLSGTADACRNIVGLNAAAGIVAGGKAADIREGLAAAYEAIDSGRAKKALDTLIALTQPGGAGH
jgi:anthranilate phosphoribosyltransferase